MFTINNFTKYENSYNSFRTYSIMNYRSVGTILLILLCTQVMAQFPTCPGRPCKFYFLFYIDNSNNELIQILFLLLVIQLCNRPSDWGTTGPRCTAGYRWWYDRSLRTCRLMWYRGCGGNSNRWCSQQECEQKCRRR